MPTLNWIGKDKVINHHTEVPFHTLKKMYDYSPPAPEGGVFDVNIPPSGVRGLFTPPAGGGGLIIHGDNLLALKSLLPEYENQIKCIYIDPPYNTGNENWVYNDNVNSPEIQAWLGKIVGKEAEDLSRHDKWLCMMYPRLTLLRKLLRNDGVIFISIDDNEQANLKLLCDEIFGSSSFIDIFSWVKTETPANLSYKTKKAVEYILCYQKNRDNTKFIGLQKDAHSSNGLMNQTNIAKNLEFPPNVIDTNIANGILQAGKYGTKNYEIILLEDTEVQNGFFVKPIKLNGKFKWNQENLNREIDLGTKVSIKTIALSPSYERLEYEPEVPWNLINRDFGVGTNENASQALKEIFGEKIFDFPKPVSLIEYLIRMVCNKTDIILDSFAGSGTTAHAVLNLNQADGGNRKFILIECQDYAETITAERVRRIISPQGLQALAGMSSGFSFYKLGEPLLIDEQLNSACELEDIRKYIWYTETGSPSPLTPEGGTDESTSKTPLPSGEGQGVGLKYFLGSFNETDIYFYYEKDKATYLDYDFLATISQKAEYYLIYADVCYLSKEFMEANHIRFKKIPRDITRI